MNSSSKQEIYKETQILSDTLDEMDVIDIFRTFYPNAEEYAFFSSEYGTFSRIDHILGHNQTSINLRKLKSYQASSTTRKKPVRNTNTWRLNNTFLNNQQVTEEIKREIKKFLET